MDFAREGATAVAFFVTDVRTMAQTICHSSFFACITAKDHTYR
jgi:hypothetical protein